MVGALDQLESHAVWIAKREHPIAESFAHVAVSVVLGVDGHIGGSESTLPPAERAAWHRERGGGGLTAAALAGCGVRPREERQQRAGAPRRVAEVEVVGAGVVEVDRELHQALTKNLLIEPQVPLRVCGNGGDVMKAGGREHERRVAERSRRDWSRTAFGPRSQWTRNLCTIILRCSCLGCYTEQFRC